MATLLKNKLAPLIDIFAKASIGDFSSDVPIAKKEDEFTPVFIGVQVMLEVIREQISALKEADLRKSEFLSMAAHELRTPLGKMSWRLETLLEENSQSLQITVKNELQIIYQNLLRNIELVNDLLSVSRVELGQTVENPRYTNIVAVIKSILKLIENEANKDKLSLSLQTNNLPKNFKLYIDPIHFSQVMQNLVSNAVKYNRRNGTIKIKVWKTENYLHISIADTGIGIAKKDQKKIFRKFFRGSNVSESKAATSVGLGLVMVKSYIKMWAGKIRFNSNLDKGTVFNLDIPLNISYT